jgi:hypothetical protein
VVHQHSSARVVIGGVCAHLNARGLLRPSYCGEKPCLSMAGVAGVRQLGRCTRVRLPPPDRRRTCLFHGAPRKAHGGSVLGQLLFITTESNSVGGGTGRHRGRQTGTWSRGLLLAEPPPRVAGHTCDGGEAVTETRKAEAEEGDKRRKAGQSVY